MRVWGWTPDCNCSPNLDHDLDAALEMLGEWPELEIELERVRADRFENSLILALTGERAPDLVWLRSEHVPVLAERGAIVGLDEVVRRMPWLVDELRDEILDRFAVEGELYAVPMGGEPEISDVAWALSSSAVERGMGEMALEVLSEICERVPLRGRPDLAVTDFEVVAEEYVEGQEMVLRTQVTNIGEEAAELIPVSFLLDGEETVDEAVIEYLEPGQSQSFETVVVVPEAGMHELAAHVDPDNMVFESNNLNNQGKIGTFFSSASGGGGPVPPTAVGAPFTVTAQAFSSRNLWGRHVKVASDGSGFLVVWKRQQPLYRKDGLTRLVGTRISASGQVLDPSGIVITSALGMYDHFNLAFDGTNYMVVWVNMVGETKPASAPLSNPYSVIEAARVSPSGAVLDTTPISIEKSPCTQCPPNYSTYKYDAPDLAFTGTDYLVVYRHGLTGKTQYMDGVYAKLVTPSGTARPGRTTLFTYPGQVEAVNMQRLAFNPVQKQGFLMFDATDFSTSPYTIGVAGAWISIQGTTITSSGLSTITSTGVNPYWKNYSYPAVAANGSGSYFGVFETNVGTGSMYCSDVAGARMGPLPGKLIQHKGAQVKGENESPAIAFNGTDYTVAFHWGCGCTAYVGAYRVNQAGQAGAYTTFKAADAVHDVDIAFSSSNGLIAYTRWVSNSMGSHYLQIKAMRISRP